MVNAFLNAGLSAQITKTIYDQAIFPYQNPGTARKRVSATLYQDTQGESDPDATYYSYDIMGNVKTLVQHSKELVAADNSNGEKRIDYEYDLISGKVNKVIYQPEKGDQFIHRYDYDADNRIINVNTSRDGLIWQNDAKYVYHLHGPLARTELGDLKVQGIDYAYTLQGWLKGVNSSSLSDPQFDIGQDGKTGGNMPIVARDAFGYMLDYYRGDYKPIGQQTYSINSLTSPSSVIPLGYRDLFNGNITGMLTNIRQLNEPMYYGYTYDQLNRIKSMDAYRGQDPQTNTWSSPVHTLDYQERISYDPNGNIKTYLRNGRTTTAMDNLTYNYTPNTNKLRQVLDAVPDGNYTEDIDGQPLADNYTYDQIGNMKTDNAGGIASITWTVYGKIKRITKSNNDFIEYRYDASGSRTSKTVSAGSTTITYYVRDAQGNVMAVYEKQAANPLKWTEQHLYGSSRLGMWTFGETIPGATTTPTGNGSLEDGFIYGKKFFELSNHIGNVLATISDKKIGIEIGATGIVDYFQPDLVTAQDYYPFGMQMVGRKFNAASYRYGFNGKENDNEVRGEGTQQDYGMRIYDSKLGRFLSVDPLTKVYPWYTPYQFAGNSPIQNIDLDGLENVHYSYLMKDGYRTKIVHEQGEIKSVPTQGMIGSFFGGINTKVRNWWNSSRAQGVQGVLSLTDIDDASVLLLDKHIDGEEAGLADKGLALVPVVGGKVLKFLVKKAEYLKYLKANGYSSNIATAIVERGSLRGALKIAKGSSDVAHHIIPVKLLKENKVVQKAVDAGFDFNSATNGAIIDKALHGSHPAYTEFVQEQIEEWAKNNKNYSAKKAREFLQNNLIPKLEKMIDQTKQANKTLNETFKIPQ